MAQPLQSFPEPPESSGSRNQLEPQTPTAKAEVVGWPMTEEFDELLTQVAMQALLMTRQATSVAIALREGSEMVCRANAGGHAPEIGDRLDMESGLSGACVQSKRVQICSDTEEDPRVNEEACRALGVRSILVAPLLEHDTLVGVMELFSPEVQSFGEDDIQTLETCAHRILDAMAKDKKSSNVDKVPQQKLVRSAEELSDQDELFRDADLSRKAEATPASESLPTDDLPDAWPALESLLLSGKLGAIKTPPMAETKHRNEIRVSDLQGHIAQPNDARSDHLPASDVQWNNLRISAAEAERSVQPPPSLLAQELPRRRDWATPVLTGLVIGLAILFGTLLGMRSVRAHANRPVARAASVRLASQTPSATLPPDVEPSAPAADVPIPGASVSSHGKQAGIVTPVKKVESDDSNAGGLVVYQNNRVVFALPPNAEKEQAGATAEPNAPAKLSSEAAGQLLVSRVEPQYPAEAVAAQIQGSVGVRLLVDRNGTVERARVFSGPPELAQAAVEAVKQWTFRPYAPDGSPKEFETTATIDFKLP